MTLEEELVEAQKLHRQATINISLWQEKSFEYFSKISDLEKEIRYNKAPQVWDYLESIAADYDIDWYGDVVWIHPQHDPNCESIRVGMVDKISISKIDRDAGMDVKYSRRELFSFGDSGSAAVMLKYLVERIDDPVT